MRRTLIGLLVAGTVLVAGCGGDDDGGDDDTGNGDGNGSESASNDPATESFCEDFLRFDQEFTENSQPDEAEVAAAIRSLDPPEEIRDEFEVVLEFIDEFASTSTTPDPDQQEELEARMAEYTEASTKVQTFVEENCGEGTSVDSPEVEGTVEGGTSDESTPETTG